MLCESPRCDPSPCRWPPLSLPRALPKKPSWGMVRSYHFLGLNLPWLLAVNKEILELLPLVFRVFPQVASAYFFFFFFLFLSDLFSSHPLYTSFWAFCDYFGLCLTVSLFRCCQISSSQGLPCSWQDLPSLGTSEGPLCVLLTVRSHLPLPAWVTHVPVTRGCSARLCSCLLLLFLMHVTWCAVPSAYLLSNQSYLLGVFLSWGKGTEFW